MPKLLTMNDQDIWTRIVTWKVSSVTFVTHTIPYTNEPQSLSIAIPISSATLKWEGRGRCHGPPPWRPNRLDLEYASESGTLQLEGAASEGGL
jgi:hypothetical protein